MAGAVARYQCAVAAPLLGDNEALVGGDARNREGTCSTASDWEINPSMILLIRPSLS